MRRVIGLALVAALVLAGASVAQTVVGTKHDLSTNLSTASQQVCVYCHTPHDSNQDAILQDRAPLWNQDLSAVTSYGVYTSDTFNATDISAVVSGTYSATLLCMSCHDGTVAPGTFYNAPNGVTATPISKIAGNANLGSDLSNDHPVNFTYASSVTNGDNGLVAEASVPAGFIVGGVGGTIQCSSCHDPHDATQDVNVDFMRDTLHQSALCTNCHVK